MKCSTNHRPGHDRAFTLLELLAAIGIVVVLAALLLGGLKTVRVASEKAKCASHLRVLGAAIQTYAAENGGRLPPGNRVNMGNLVRILANDGYTEPMKSVIMAPDVFYCPTNVRLQSPPAGGYPIGPNGTGYKGWSGYMTNYLINASVFPITSSDPNAASYVSDEGGRVRLASINVPSRTVALMDTFTRFTSSVGPPVSGLARNYYFNPQNSSFSLGTIHNGLGNILFLDGHVEPFTANAPLSVYSMPGQEEPWYP